ncbi:uncharacterized protein [Nicotiana sylvestris]|uniref:uncharacterized protein n=1 Tax=Nicotiana sylvestris TaxID=4096 RepID=UPI00388C6873
MVPVPKKDGKTRVCVDYQDLNKESPKDNFPLPNIHILVDNCAKHEIQTFVDCYAGYYQVLMDEEDAEKTAFTTGFIAQLTSTCEPIFKLLKKDVAIRWTDECQEAFDKIKENLLNPPVLVRPEPGRPLFLYEACIMGMNMAVDQDVEEFLIMGDSDLIIRQAQGEWETRDIKLIPYRKRVEDLSKRFKSVEFRYLKIKEYSEQASGDQKRTIRRLASSFFLSGEVLYKRTPDLNLLRCVDAQEAGKIMSEVHAGVCGPDMNGYILAKKILQAGYYWMTMEKHCFSFVRKCHQCQDVIGPIEPKASNGHKFILVAIDYFTKWVEAVTKKAVVDFVHSNIICRFGIPKAIITDNAANLNSHLMREFFTLRHKFQDDQKKKSQSRIKEKEKEKRSELKVYKRRKNGDCSRYD